MMLNFFLSILSDGGGVQRDSRLHCDVSFRSHCHDLKGSEQSKNLSGNRIQCGIAQDCFHQQLQHVSNKSVVLTLSALWSCPPLCVFVSQRDIDGRVYVGQVKEKEKAKKEYEKAVSSGHTAGLVKYVALTECIDAVDENSLTSFLSLQGFWKKDGDIFSVC